MRSSEDSDRSEQLSTAAEAHIVPSSSEHSTVAGSSPSHNRLFAPADPAEELFFKAKSQLVRGVLPDLSGVSPVALQLRLWDRLEQSIEEEQQLLNWSKADLSCQPQLRAGSGRKLSNAAASRVLESFLARLAGMEQYPRNPSLYATQICSSLNLAR